MLANIHLYLNYQDFFILTENNWEFQTRPNIDKLKKGKLTGAKSNQCGLFVHGFISS